ncbi:DsbA family protein [Microbacterium sp.]|uniref:DsbA family protein n=1 Tax=Microbacterium sp. TaxID=51671 RepID=UPI003A86588D
MSDDDSARTPVPRHRRAAVREKAKQVRARQSRARAITRSLVVVGAVAVVAAVAITVTWTVVSAVSRPQLSPENVSGGGFPVTAIAAAVSGPEAVTEAEATIEDESSPAPTESPTALPQVEIQVYVDYLSPGARDWQVANSPQLASWVNEGAASLTYYPVSMLTAKSNGTKYSLRAAGAAACVGSHAPETFYAYNNELLLGQPEIDSDGMSDTDLADLAQATGVDDPKTVRDCIEDGDFLTWAKKTTESAVAGIPGTDGLALTGTPMVLVNGQRYVGALSDPAEFSQFVLTTASGAFYQTQTSTPTPTPTAAPSETPTPSATPSE